MPVNIVKAILRATSTTHTSTSSSSTPVIFFIKDASVTSAVVLEKTHNYYILHHDPAHASLADVAAHLGLQIVNPIGELKDMWLARTSEALPSLRDSLHARDTKIDPVIESYWTMRRDASLSRRSESISSAVKHISRQIPRKVIQNASTRIRSDTDPSSIVRREGVEDPSFPEQWSLVDPDHSMNVVPVWEKQGYTGKGVLIAVIDNGLKHDHKDLESNFDARHSFDFIDGSRRLPIPSKRDWHGTAVAGVIAAAKNDICGVGIAYNSKVAGLRIVGTDGVVHPVHEATALNHGAQNVAIYNSAHGTVTYDSPHYAVKQAHLYGVTYGRDSKGSIYVVAAGNDPEADGNCNTNGWANGIHTISIGAVDKDGKSPGYAAPCTAVMAVAYSSNTENTSRIFSLGVAHDEACSSYFKGTSAAAPAASAIFALALEANPNLTWRDIQYLIVKTSKFIWDEWTAVAGRKYSEKYGFGLLDAHAFVGAAKDWKTVPERTWIEMKPFQFDHGTMDRSGKFSGGLFLPKMGVSTPVRVTEDMADKQNFLKIERVEVKVWVKHQKRGDIEITLISPSGTESKLGTRRKEDRDKTGLRGWTFMSVKHWGESPVGEWTVRVNDQKHRLSRATGNLIGFKITFWGCANEKGWDKIYEMPADDYNVFPPPDRRTIQVDSDDDEEEEGITGDYALDSD